jgi:hypothetical protein
MENISLGPVEIATTAKNVQIKEHVEISYLLKPLTVYADIIRELAPPEVRDNLSSALFRYMHHLLDINERCTWHSVRLYHFSFHRKRMLSSTGVYDYEGWLKYNDSEFQYLLQARTVQGTKRPSDGHPSGPPAKRFNTGNGAAASAGSASARSAQSISDACRRHNGGLCTAGPSCKYRHVGWTCGDGAHVGPACSQHYELRGDEVEGEWKMQGNLSKVLYTSRTSIEEPPLVVSQNSSPACIQIPYPLADTSSPHLVDPGPLNPAAWFQWLTHHPDRTYAQTLVDMINHGAKIGYVRGGAFTRPCL